MRRVGDCMNKCPWAALLGLVLLSAACSDDGSKGVGEAADAGAGPVDPTSLSLTVSGGTIEGTRVGSTREFLGIPYAKPPLGALRFMPPEPAEPWSGTLDASKFGPSCPQPQRVITPPGPQSEDCLTLNVFAPDATGGPRAVMVWIHGGGFTGGGTVQYNGERISSERDVIVVTLNYRLGPLGFYTSPALDAERSGVPSGNDGLRDQLLALRWVHDNIAKFGGDPERVTLFGESAGGFSTCMHFASPQGHDYAQRFIVQSGACVSVAGINSKQKSRALSTEFAQALCGDSSDVVACLRAKDVKDVVGWGADRSLLGAGWAPLYGEGDPLLPAAPLALIKQGSASKGELIVGTTKSEWGLFTTYSTSGGAPSTVSGFEALLRKELPEIASAAPAIVQHYAPTDATAGASYIQAITDALFRCPARALAREVSARGNDVYLYSFEQGRAFHAYEIPYVFGFPSALLDAPTVDPLHGSFASYWTQFAKTGDPNGADQPTWPAYDTASDPHIVLKDPVVAETHLAKDACDFWETLVKP